MTKRRPTAADGARGFSASAREGGERAPVDAPKRLRREGGQPSENRGRVPRWLLLAHQLPTTSSNARVKTWRPLQQLGAVPVRNSVYVLPNTDQCREDFEWMRSEIVALGGSATVFAADAVDATGNDEIEAVFRKARDADYEELTRDVRRHRATHSLARRSAERAKAAERLAVIRRIDFFNAPAGGDAADAVAALERRAAPPAAGQEHAMHMPSKEFVNRRWVTRPRPGVDRMASAWLIRRFIDPKATFAFVERPSAAEVPFDMYAGDFSHHGKLCTFEVLAQRFAIADPAVNHLARIVHDLDMKENRYSAPEAPAVGRMVDGLRQLHADDGTLLEQGIAMFEALARSITNDTTTKHTGRPKDAKKRKRVS